MTIDRAGAYERAGAHAVGAYEKAGAHAADVSCIVSHPMAKWAVESMAMLPARNLRPQLSHPIWHVGQGQRMRQLAKPAS